jgi:adenylate cyclase
VLALDVVGYSRLMAADETGTYAALVDCQKTILEPLVKTHAGRVVKLMGDGALVEFQSVVDAVECGIAIQAGFAKRDVGQADDKAIHVRIGINLGDIILDKGDIFGDGVNVAARLEAIAEPGGICIAGSVFDQVRSKIDVDFEDLGEQSVKNIAEPVRVYRVVLKAAPMSPSATPSVPSSNRPSIAILPFDNLSGDADQQYFCDGVSEDLTTALSRFDWLFVAARNAAFRYKGQPVDVRKVGQELGVRYLLEGSIRVAGGRARVNVQMIETGRQGHVWADRLNADLSDPFEAQDDLVIRIASTVGPELLHAEIARAKQLPEDSLSAWDHGLLGYDGFYATTPESFEAAASHLRRAIEVEPDFALAYARLALCYFNAAGRGWERPAKEAWQRARENAERAVAIAPASPDAYLALGWVLCFTNHGHDAVTVARQAIELNPSFGEAHGLLGNSLMVCGQMEEALEACRIAESSKPRDSRGTWLLSSIAWCHYFLGDFEKAVEAAKMGLRRDPSIYGALVTLACANARLGRMVEAKRAVDRLLQEIPRYSLRAVRKNPMFLDPEDIENLLEGLRLAGLPE